MTEQQARHRIKVLHAPTAVGGNPQGQVRALRQVGVDAYTAVFTHSYFNYPADFVLSGKNKSRFIREIKKIFYFITWLGHYDIFHFNAGSSLFSIWPDRARRPDEKGLKAVAYIVKVIMAHLFRMIETAELGLYRFFGKPVFVTYQGDDARQGDYCMAHFPINMAEYVEPGYYDARSDAFKRKRIRTFGRYCERIYALNPDLLWVLPSSSEFLPYSNISLDDWRPKYTQMHEGSLRIAHAPSHRGAKGTALILAAFEKLRSEGKVFETLLIEGMSHADARKVYEEADIFIDQLFAGWYGGVAVEAMALGKPVLVYIRDSDLVFIPEEMRQDLPFINVTPDSIVNKLREVLNMSREELLNKAKASRAFVEKWHDPILIAERLKTDYESALSRSEKAPG